MSEFVNTVDIVGDEALTASIIDKTITEIADNITTYIGEYAFKKCSKLTSVDFPNVTSIDGYAFASCTELTEFVHKNDTPIYIDDGAFYATSIKRIDLCGRVSLIGNYLQTSSPFIFYNTPLSALILRSTELCSIGINVTNLFTNTPIASGTGYIYVPKALIEDYKVATNWSTYANQIRAIEDYPEVCDPYNWETFFKTLDAGTYKDYYKVGDCIPLDLGSEGIINMQIAAFDADDLADGSGKARVSWIARDLPNTGQRMNPNAVRTTDESGATVYTEGTGSIGGWEKSEMRNTHIPALAAMIPENIRARVVKVKKTQTSYDTSKASVSQTTEDEYFIPSRTEIDTGGIYASCYPDEASRMKSSVWWLRDACAADCFWCVVRLGEFNNFNLSSTDMKIALSFCT